jgi:hypothetical protein
VRAEGQRIKKASVAGYSMHPIGAFL